MKVALIASIGSLKNNISNTTGVGRYVQELKKKLSQNLQVDTIGYDNSSLLHSVKSLINLNFKNYRQYDIIHLLEPKPLFPFLKKKFVITVHDLFFLRYRESKGILTSFYPKSTLKSISYADAIIAVSSLTAKEVRKYNKRVYVVNLGVSDTFFSTPLMKRKNKVFKIGYIGRVDHERKNLIRGIGVFKKFEEDAEFEIWGGYSEDNELSKKILKESIEDPRIKIKGPFKDEDIITIYDSFDAFFLPSKEEGFGLPILEAQSRGVPVIVFKDSLIPEEVCKYCIKINDELPSIEEIKEFKEKYEKEMIKYAKQFTWDKTAKETLKIYEKEAIVR
ncbi:glycosyltransferase [Sulfolobus tengchongensis]|uniref:Glycosyltransferase n=1 Tax=Sulfolobus tengchongensis TaxID=207809 RepID=A0AAX4KYG2_9CREN